VLRRVLASLAELGYEAVAAVEYEMRLWDAEGKPLSSGLSYSLGELGGFSGFLSALTPALDALGVDLSAVHTEAGAGLLELNLGARPALRAADDAVLTKMAVKDIAATMGWKASFLAKTSSGEEGSSGHVHLSCWSGGANAFRASDGMALPPAFSSAIAGVLAHLPGARLVCARKRKLGSREPLVRRSGNCAQGLSRPVPPRVPPPGGGRQPIPGDRGGGRLRRRWYETQAHTARADRGRCLFTR
jgi:glutamine synthetase